MPFCSQCGAENKPGNRFCKKCGAGLEAAQRPTAAAPGAAETQQPAAAQPTQTPQPYAPPVQMQQAPYQSYDAGAPPGTQWTQPAAPSAYAGAAPGRPSLFRAGAVIVLVAGLIILVSTFLTWGSSSGGYTSLSGWDFYEMGSEPAGPGEISTPFFYLSADRHLFFTGLCTLILGISIAILGGLILLVRRRGLGMAAVAVSALALLLAFVNLTTFLRSPAVTMREGMYLFLLFSLLGVVGGLMARAGLPRSVRA